MFGVSQGYPLQVLPSDMSRALASEAGDMHKASMPKELSSEWIVAAGLGYWDVRLGDSDKLAVSGHGRWLAQWLERFDWGNSNEYHGPTA